ncbi:MAG: PilN domain-containing protein [Nitrospirota bacterium]
MNGTTIIKKLTDFASVSSDVLNRIWEPLRRILTFSPAADSIYPGRNLSVSLEKGGFSIAYGSRFLSKIKIKSFRSYPLEEGKFPQPEVLAYSLPLAINQLDATKAEVSVSIPKAWAVIKTVEFPIAVKENLSDVISFELDRITPFTPEEALYDYKILREDKDKIEILIVAAKAEFVKPYLDSLKDHGINVNRVTINLSAIETLCRFIGIKTESLFIEVKDDGYEGGLFIDGSIRDSFSGSFTASEEEAKIGTIMAEISSFIEKLKSKGRPAQILALLRNDSPALKEALRHTDLPVKALDETEVKINLPGPVNEAPLASIGAVIESLWPKSTAFNLLAKGRHEKTKHPRTLTAILLLAILALWVMYLIAPLRIEERRLKEIENQIALRKDEVKKVEAIKKEIEEISSDIGTINSFKGSGPMALDVLKELTAILPKNAWLTRVRISENTVNLEGYSASATGLLPKLEASPHFNKAEFASPTFRDTRMNADRFNIKMEIESSKEDALTKNRQKEAMEEDEEE